jgi:mannosyltransferase
MVVAAVAERRHVGRHAASEVPLWIAPPVVTMAVMLWGIQVPSYSRDESATMSAVLRPFHGLLRMLGRVDAVHGMYYAAIWPVVRLFGPGELATRLPSALAMAVAAAAIFGLGQRLVSPRAGLAAGLVFAILPEVSLYGQTARPYAMATALAAIASYLLVRAIEVAGSGDRAKMRGWLLWYGVCLAALGYMHVFGLLLAAAHAVPVARAWLRHARDRNGRSLALSWLAVVVAAFAVAGGVIAAGMEQRASALTWVKSGSLSGFAGLTSLIGPRPMAAAACLAVMCGIAVSAFVGRARLRARWPGDLIALCVPWLILPAAILILASSLFTPIYVFRYVIFCTPAAALLVGAGLAALDWRAGTAAFAIIAVLAMPALLQVRTAGGHGDDIRAADRIVAATRRPGDALLYLTFGEPIQRAYPYGIRQLRNVALGGTPNYSATLGGTWAPLSVVRQRIEAARRIWLIQLAYGLYERSPGQPPMILQNLDFRKVRTWHTTGIWLTLYARRTSGLPVLLPGWLRSG